MAMTHFTHILQPVQPARARRVSGLVLLAAALLLLSSSAPAASPHSRSTSPDPPPGQVGPRPAPAERTMIPGGGHDVIAPAPGPQSPTTPAQDRFPYSTTVSLAPSPVPAPVVTDPAVSVDAPGPASPPVPAGPGAPDLGTSASSPVPAGPALAGTASQETSAPATLTVPPDPASRTEPASPPVPAGPTETTGPTELASPSRPTGPEPPPVPGSTPVTGTTAGAHPTVLTHGQTAPVAGLTVSDATWLVPDAAGVSVPGSGQSDPAPLPQRSPRVRYTWPTGGPVAVLASFDPPAHDWLRGHRGVDLALAAGSPVRAAAAGTVAFSGPVAGRPVVSIDHADGIRTTYEPVEPCVQAGDHVEAGQVIGTLLAGHRTDGVDALHWGARTGRKSYINPLRLLTSTVIRLKPSR